MAGLFNMSFYHENVASDTSMNNLLQEITVHIKLSLAGIKFKLNPVLKPSAATSVSQNFPLTVYPFWNIRHFSAS